ncbi:MAG: phosphoribosylanthranilate isomerase [Dehalococcoidia bacterium]
MTRVKICGCRTVEHALVAAEAGADFVGIMFAPESRRRVEPEDAAEIVRALGTPLAELEQRDPPSLFRTDAKDPRSWYEHGASALDRLLERKRPLTVGVFAKNDPDEINEIVDECGIDLIQLHGGEPWGNVLLANRQVIKVVHVAPGDDEAAVISRIETGSAIAVFLESGGTGVSGGSGISFDWNVAAAVAKSMPIWLAGGLNPGNVAEAITRVRPWAVDVSSGTETDGVKDLKKIRAFVRAAKSA